MADPTPIYQEAAKLSQEAYKAAKAQSDTIITDMGSRTASIFRQTVEKAKVRVNEVGEKAMAEAVQDLAYQGIYASSHLDKNGKLYRVPADVAVRQAVYTSGRQRFNGQVLDVARRTGQDLIEVNSTANCRPSHERINGGIFSISGLDYRFPRWTSDMEALLSDYNCGHRVAVYHENLGREFSDPLEGTGYTIEEARKAFAKQRRYENEIRKQKRVVEALKAGGMDTAAANRKLNATRHRLQKHIDENSAILRRERHREQLYDSAQRMKNVKRVTPPPAPKAPTAKVGAEKLAKTEKPRLNEETIRNFTNGHYADVADITQQNHGGNSMWEFASYRRKAFEDSNSITLAARKAVEKDAEDIYQAVVNAKGPERTLVRTETFGPESERFSSLPEVGTELNFGVKSTAADAKFAEKVARDEIPGLGASMSLNDDAFYLFERGHQVQAFRVKSASRYLDISKYSEFTDQKEALIAGRYKVTGIERKTVEFEDPRRFAAKVKVSPADYAIANGWEIETFTSKKGKELFRFKGDGANPNNAYPISRLNDGAMFEIDKKPIQKVEVIYIDLEEI